MVTPKKTDVQSTSEPEYLIFDTGAPDSTAPSCQLLESLGKFQGLCVKATLAAVRGFNITGFSVQVYAAPKGLETGGGYSLRVVYLARGLTNPGKNTEIVGKLCEMAQRGATSV
jgi:hypothetical protein